MNEILENPFKPIIFEYFDKADNNKFQEKWLDHNINLYNETRRAFHKLIDLIKSNTHLNLSKRSLSRPKRSYQVELKGYIKNFCKISKEDHIHFQLGHKKDDNYLLIKEKKYVWTRNEILSEDFIFRLLELING